jgi:hypothetical protein
MAELAQAIDDFTRHSVFTTELIDAAGEPTRAAVDEVIALFRDKLAARAAP